MLHCALAGIGLLVLLLVWIEMSLFVLCAPVFFVLSKKEYERRNYALKGEWH